MHSPFWTFQRKPLVKQLLDGKPLVPDFSVGPIAGSSTQAYTYLLERYNILTSGNHAGLVFGVIGSSDHPSIKNVDTLLRVVKGAGEPSGVLFSSDTHTLLRLGVPDNIYVLPVDFYRFSDLLYFTEEGAEEGLELARRDLFYPNLPNGRWELMCGHIPYIDPSWVVEVVQL